VRILLGLSASLLLAALVVAACGVSHDGPPPRYAEAPPEPGGDDDDDAPVASDGGVRSAPEAPDAGVAAVDGGDAGPSSSDGGVPEPTPGPVLATAVPTQEQWAAMLEAGRRKWNRVCGECHGTGIGPALNGRRLAAERVRTTVRRGRGDMRPLSERRVSADDLEAVLVYLSTIRAVSDVSPPAAPAQ